jgi:hypothetical protein
MRLAGVLLAVLALHAWLLGPGLLPLGRRPAAAPAIQLVMLAPATAPAPAAQAVGPQPAAAPTPPPQPQTHPAAPAAPAPALQPKAPDQPVDWTAGPQAPEAVAGTPSPAAELAASAPAAPLPGPVAGAEAGAGGGPPPVYSTVLPSRSFQLDYRVERGDDAGIGQLAFELQPDQKQYRAHLYGAAGGKVLLDWVSRGGFDAAGIAPQRLVERQRNVDARAANFQRDQGVISFSSSTRALALYPGAQDRLSVLLQLMAVAAAEPGGLHPGQRLRLQVAGTRGQAEVWVFEVLGGERLEAAGRPIETVHLVREPTQPYDQRVEAWLAPAAGHLPVGLRLTQVPSRGPPQALWLDGPLPGLPP